MGVGTAGNPSLLRKDILGMRGPSFNAPELLATPGYEFSKSELQEVEAFISYLGDVNKGGSNKEFLALRNVYAQFVLPEMQKRYAEQEKKTKSLIGEDEADVLARRREYETVIAGRLSGLRGSFVTGQPSLLG